MRILHDYYIWSIAMNWNWDSKKPIKLQNTIKSVQEKKTNQKTP
jgi:hypothetical protein